MYKKIILNQYEIDKFNSYTNADNSRFELSLKYKINSIKNVEFLYALSKTVNDTPELKRSFINGELVEFLALNPAYILDKNGEIVNTYTDFSYNFDEFNKNYKKDYEIFLKSDLIFTLKQAPINSFYVSSFKGYFDNFSLHLKNGFEFFMPIFTTFKKDDDFIIYANFHHAFFDLKRAKEFFDRLKANLIKPS